MRRLIGILVLVFSISVSAFSQKDSVYFGNRASKTREQQKDYKWIKKFTYGGNFQTLLGNYTYIYLSPTLGYMPVKKLNVGLGFIYNYSNWDFGRYGRVPQTVFGGHSYLRYNVLPNFFVQGQFDKLRQQDRYNPISPDTKVWVNYMLGGIGFSQPVSHKFALNTTLMYNFTPSRLSIYPIPLIFQIGFTGMF
jgi:hypothetical protein